MLEIGQQEIDAVARVTKSGHLLRYGDPKRGHLEECSKFEKELAAMVDCRYALSVTSGAAALACTLVGLGIGPAFINTSPQQNGADIRRVITPCKKAADAVR